MFEPLISVIIPIHNAERTLNRCLDAVYRSDYCRYEVIAVDDASTDRSADIAATYPCTLIRLPRNEGAACAKNRGAGHAQGEVLFFTDSDVMIPPNALKIVAKNLQDDEVTGVVGLLSSELPFSDFASQFKNLWMHYTYSILPRRVGLFYTSAASIRRAVFEAEGGFDEGYTGASVTEDMDFGQRLLTAGYQIVLDQRLQVRHLKHYELGELLRTDLVRAGALTKIVLRNKINHSGRKHFASVPWFFTASVPISALIVLGLLWSVFSPAWGLGLATLSLLAILALNAPFLRFLGQQRGLGFLLQSALFLPVNLFVSGLGIAWAIVAVIRGDRY